MLNFQILVTVFETFFKTKLHVHKKLYEKLYKKLKLELRNKSFYLGLRTHLAGNALGSESFRGVLGRSLKRPPIVYAGLPLLIPD